MSVKKEKNDPIPNPPPQREGRPTAQATAKTTATACVSESSPSLAAETKWRLQGGVRGGLKQADIVIYQ